MSGACFRALGDSSLAATFDVQRVQGDSALLEFRMRNTSNSRITFGPSAWELFNERDEGWTTSMRGRACDLGGVYLEAGHEFLWHVDLTAYASPPANEPPRYSSNVDYHRDHDVAVLDDVFTSFGPHAFVVREFSVDPDAVVFPFRVGETTATTG